MVALVLVQGGISIKVKLLSDNVKVATQMVDGIINADFGSNYREEGLTKDKVVAFSHDSGKSA